MSGRGTANLLTRTTAVLAAIFFGLSLTLALLNKGTAVQRSVLDLNQPASSTAPAVPAAPGSIIPGSSAPGTTVPAPATPAPAAPTPGGPSGPTH
jgi:preprotein translocase subunit SecG